MSGTTSTSIYDLFFELEMSLCERFPAMTPLSIRKERAVDVFRLIVRYAGYAKKQSKNAGKPKIIRRPAGDTWF